jgi:endonuclease/exonuclease/phosphatase family metal-dependent hydrolase
VDAPPPATLRLLTFNCLWRPDARARLAVLGRWLEGSDLDVVCLQEVVFRSRIALVRSLAPSFRDVAFLPFGIVALGGLVVLSRWPVVARHYIMYRLRGRWRNRGRTDWLMRKGLLLVELDAGGRRVVVVNTHLLANYEADWSEANDYARQEHAELDQLADVVEAVDLALPLVVTGDLNVPSRTWLFDDFVRRTGLRDAFAGGGEPTCRPAPADGSPYDIDHVLVRGPVQASAELRFRDPVRLPDGRETPLSDHLGIAAELRLDER